jgi:thiol-disulfide isomerase/thioredoxin
MHDEAGAREEVERAHAELELIAPGEGAGENERKGFANKEGRWIKVARMAGVDAVAASKPRQVDWETAGRAPLADFAVSDLQGRHWDIAAWAGKVVYVNVWAIWCIPCRAELPNIQKLHDDLRERTDRLVITLNIDDDDDLTRTFPVVSAQKIAGLTDALDVPQNWLIDAQGRRLVESTGIRCSGCAAEVAKIMDRIAQSPGSGARK